MRKKKLTYIVIFILLILSLVLTSRYFAIQNTILECNHFHLRQIESIDKISTSFYLLKYLPNYTQNNYYKTFFSPHLPVLVVDMEGTWEIFGGPPPEAGQLESPPQRFDTCGSIINFFTTQALSAYAD
jgi:hypothetical protein